MDDLVSVEGCGKGIVCQFYRIFLEFPSPDIVAVTDGAEGDGDTYDGDDGVR